MDAFLSISSMASRSLSVICGQMSFRISRFSAAKSSGVMSMDSMSRNDCALNQRPFAGKRSASTSANISSEPKAASRRLLFGTSCCSRLSTLVFLPSYRKNPSGDGSAIVVPPTTTVCASALAIRITTNHAANRRADCNRTVVMRDYGCFVLHTATTK